MYLIKMSLVLPLIGFFLIGIASALRNCDDCTDIDKCSEALIEIKHHKSDALTKKLREALCGERKICCSDFFLGLRMTIDDDIENHPNVNLLPDECGVIEGSRIIGGNNAKMNEFPWLALISHNINGMKKFNCGGTVINERYVLTAAHCIIGYTIVGVRIGEYDIGTRTDCWGNGILRTCQSNLQDVAVSQAIAHPNYVSYPILLNDIGLLRLKKPLNLTVANAGTVCLPIRQFFREMNIVGEEGIVAGWGATENGTMSNVLLKVDLPILDKEMCKSIYDGDTINPRTKNRLKDAFCAGKPRRDSCSGDSGGPLMLEAAYLNDKYKLIQFGVVSYGARACGNGIPGVYTDVGKFMKWILDNIKP